MSNNIDVFYEKKEIYEMFNNDGNDGYKHFTEIVQDPNKVEVQINNRVGRELVHIADKERIFGIIKDYILSKQKDIERQILLELNMDMNSAADLVIKDLNLKEIVWVKQEVD